MGFMKRPKAPEPTAQEKAVVERQSRMLDEEMEESEKRLKAIARGKLGSKSLLAKAASASGQSGVPKGFTFSVNDFSLEDAVARSCVGAYPYQLTEDKDFLYFTPEKTV